MIPTTIKQKQAAIIRNQARVIDLLKWRPSVYSAFMHNCGLQYLALYVGPNEQLAGKLERIANFWAWWKNLFNARDEAFIDAWDGLEDSIDVEDMRKLYKDIHNPALLVAELHPPKIARSYNINS